MYGMNKAFETWLRGANLGADVRTCIFGEAERAIEVPVASLASEREVVCVTPHWEIRPWHAVSERVLVRLSAEGSGAAHASAAYVTFVAWPQAQRLEPNEGPVEGGTSVRVHGRHFRPNGEAGGMACHERNIKL